MCYNREISATTLRRPEMPRALIIGAGRHVGRALIQKLVQEGWKISVGSMEPDYETASREGYLTFRAPLTQSDVLYAALGDAVMNLGAFPNVIVYNGPYRGIQTWFYNIIN